MTRRRRLLAAVLAAVVVVGVAGALWFEPWRLFTHSYADEPLPAALSTAAPATPGATGNSSAAPSTAAPPTDVLLSRTALTSGEHTTTGDVLVIRLADGRHVVRLMGFTTSDGPDVRVVLATTESGSLGVGGYLELGSLRATSGNLNYAVPAGTDLAPFRSVAIWCKRFDAVFGSAPLGVAG